MSNTMQSTNERQRLPHIGCCDIGPSPATYFKRLSALEYQQTFFSPPKNATLVKLRKRAPADFSFFVRAWQLITHDPSSAGYRRLAKPLTAPKNQYGRFQLTESVLEAWQRTLACAESLDARGVLFETPTSFSPSGNNRLQLTRFFEQIERKHFLMVWQPSGLWAEPEVMALCKDLDLTLALDPLSTDELPEAKQIYFKLDGFGQTQAYSDTALLKLIERARSFDQTYCLFNSLNMFRDATHTIALFNEQLEGHMALR